MRQVGSDISSTSKQIIEDIVVTYNDNIPSPTKSNQNMMRSFFSSHQTNQNLADADEESKMESVLEKSVIVS